MDLSAWLPPFVAANWAEPQVTATVPDVPAVVAISPESLGAALNALVGDALRAGGPVSITATVRGDRVMLTVDNRGPPIPEELRGRVFEADGRLAAWPNLPDAAALLRAAGGKVGIVPHRGGVRIAVSLPRG